MSYDLYFRPRTGRITRRAFDEYFFGRAHFKVNLPQAWYENEDTGVCFSLLLGDYKSVLNAERFDVALNMNYFRPSYFVLEAEPHVSAFVRRFDLVVSDPQIAGMADGEYQPELLLSGWRRGNEFGCGAILQRHGDPSSIAHLPAQVLNKAWQWNLGRAALQQRLGDSRFVPTVMSSALTAFHQPWPCGQMPFRSPYRM